MLEFYSSGKQTLLSYYILIIYSRANIGHNSFTGAQMRNNNTTLLQKQESHKNLEVFNLKKRKFMF